MIADAITNMIVIHWSLNHYAKLILNVPGNSFRFLVNKPKINVFLVILYLSKQRFLSFKNIFFFNFFKCESFSSNFLGLFWRNEGGFNGAGYCDSKKCRNYVFILFYFFFFFILFNFI
jgi:hypothetical protein